MKKEIVNLIIDEILNHKEEIRRLEIKDRLAYIGFLIQEISGIPALYFPKKEAEKIINIIEKEVRLSSGSFS